MQKDYINSLGMRFVRIPAGSFLMGAEKPGDDLPEARPQHAVRLTRAFYLARHTVTQAQWEAVMGENPSRHKGAELPVENVSYVDAQIFILRLNQREQTDRYRLPSEAEWEYAARAGTTTAWSCGDSADFLDRHAWVDDGDDSWIEKLDIDPEASMSMEEFFALEEAAHPLFSHPVGGKAPNPWGLYDMHGNVEE